MIFEWDKDKERRNLTKHGISFATAKQVFADRLAVAQMDRLEGHEERWQLVGVSSWEKVLVVIFTWRKENGDEVIRIISARKASPRERTAYEEGH